MSHADSCSFCGEGWRIDATELRTGIVKAVLHPIGVGWEEAYSRPSQGATIVVATRDPRASDIWPHDTGIYISRVMTNGTRYGHFGGYVEKFSGAGGGATNIAVQPMDEYLFHQLLADDDEGLSYSTPGYVAATETTPVVPGPGKSQTTIAVELFNIAVTGRTYLPFIASASPSSQLRVRHWDPWEFKNIGQAIQELVAEPNGLTYRLVHTFFENPQRWETRILFADEQNTDRGLVLRSDIESWQYGLDVDGKNQAGRVYGVGTGEGTQQMFSIAYDVDGSLPEFRATKAWKDVTVPATLDDYARGAVSENRDPISTPFTTLAGLTDVPVERLQVGDIVSAEIGYGVITFEGEKARVQSIAWNVGIDHPVTRTPALSPIIRPSLSVKTQVPAKAPTPLTPAQGANPPPVTPIAPPTPSLPSQVLNLTNWKLTLPIGSEGKPTEIKQPALATYSHADLFHTVTGPGVLFKAPRNGVTTPNSENTRTELREMKNNGRDNASWSSGTMEAYLSFDPRNMPSSKPHIVGMQIHDSEDDVSVLRLEGTDLWLTKGDTTHGKKILTGYQPDTKIRVKVIAGGGTIRWYLNDMTNPVWSFGKSISGGYFKAGCYQQAGHSGSGYGLVTIYELKVTH